MAEDRIGLKLGSGNATAAAITVIREYSGSTILQIRKSIQKDKYVLSRPYTDRHGLKSVIACYEELERLGIKAEIYEMDNEPATIDFLKTLDATYDEISDEINST